jgi:hypothetical protein
MDVLSMVTMNDIENKIKARLIEGNYGKCRNLSLIGEWAGGTVYAASTGFIRQRKYAVYVTHTGDIHSIRFRGYK